MRVCFELSGEHDTLPLAEARSVLEAESIPHRILLEQPRVLIAEVDPSFAHKLASAAGRLAMCHSLHQVLAICAPDREAIIHALVSLEPCRLLQKGERYRVRVKDLSHTACSPGKPQHLSLRGMEAQIGGLLHACGFRAELERPDVSFNLLITQGFAVFTRLLCRVNRAAFRERAPQNKPFFYPGVLMPGVSRALVNLCQTRRGDVVLDPFCGTGGILVEAGLLGAKVVGSDVQHRILLGAEMNLRHYLKDWSLLYQDATRLALVDESVDVVVTDPPYGRSARIKSGESLMKNSLLEIHRVLKEGRRAAVIYNRPLEELLECTGFFMVECHRHRVHRSMTRHMYIVKK